MLEIFIKFSLFCHDPSLRYFSIWLTYSIILNDFLFDAKNVNQSTINYVDTVVRVSVQYTYVVTRY